MPPRYKSQPRLDDAGPETITVFRSDRGELRKARKTDEGYLVVDGFIARPGIYRYTLADGSIRRELVTAEVLANKKSLDTLRLKPVTNGHPNPIDFPDMVTQENIQELSVGSTGQEVTIASDGRPAFTFTVQQADAVADVENGKTCLSPGYQVDLVLERGEHPKFGKFDAKQENRRYNHLALTSNPRGGASVCLRLDGAGVRTDEDAVDLPDHQEITVNLIEEIMKATGCSKADAERLLADPKALLARVDSLEGVTTERDDFKVKAEKFDALPSDADVAKAEASARKERRDLDAIAAELKLDAGKTDELSNLDLKSGILEAAKVDVPKIDGVDDAAGIAFTWATFLAARKAGGGRKDSEETGNGSGLRIDEDPSGGDEDFVPARSVLNRYDSRNTHTRD